MKLNEITFLHIELTTNCNARCPKCIRNYCGFEYNSGYPLTQLSLTQIQKILPLNFLKQIIHIQFNGNLGDFGMAKQAKEIVEWLLKNSNATISIETNGSMRGPEWWASLADQRVMIFWAIDGIDNDTHILYRTGTNFKKVLENAQAFIDAGGKAVWKFIPFEHNKHQLESAKKLSVELGFFDFRVWDQGRNQGPVYTKTGEFSHWLGPPDVFGPPPLEDMLHNHKTWFDSKTVASTMDINEESKLQCEHIDNNEIYIAADGSVYPCCYIGAFPTTMHHPGNSQIAPLVNKNNALEYPIEQCVEWFTNLYESWTKPTIAEGKPFICLQTCGRCNQ